MDNLEVTVTNVHLRFEDSITLPGRTYAAGITLQSFNISTCDAMWNTAFVILDHISQQGVKVYKTMRVENLGVYWFERTQALEPLANVQWEKEMKRIMQYKPTEESKVQGKGQAKAPVEEYILEPHNKIIVKVTHSDSSSSSIPRVDLLVEGVDLRLSLTKGQLHQFISMLTMFASLGRLKLIALYRPDKQVIVDPKAWWKYAFYIVAGKSFTGCSKITDALGEYRYTQSPSPSYLLTYLRTYLLTYLLTYVLTFKSRTYPVLGWSGGELGRSRSTSRRSCLGSYATSGHEL